jgi:hypothetical protein
MILSFANEAKQQRIPGPALRQVTVRIRVLDEDRPIRPRLGDFGSQ